MNTFIKGPYSVVHRTYSLPFNHKLRKKKKYKKAKKQNIPVKQHKIVPFYKLEDPAVHDSLKYFRGNFHALCEGIVV